MASVEEKDAAAAAGAGSHMSYKDALVDGGVPDSNPAVTTSQQDEGKVKPAEPAKDEKKKEDATQNLKSNLLISGAVIAVIGAIFAIVKKMKAA